MKPRKPYEQVMAQSHQDLQKFLGQLELAVMEIIWQRETVTVRDVLTVLQKERTLAYTTVMTIMQRLTDKGLLLAEKAGKAHRYRAAQTREDFIASLAASGARSLLNDFGEVGMVQFVKELEALDPNQLARLADLAYAAKDNEDESQNASPKA
jgi:predicted transcriptional regulator